MSATRFQEALTDVSKVFSNPGEILSATDLRKPQKVELLKQWEYDLRLQLIALEANMPAGAPSADARPSAGRSAGLLREVRATLNAVEAVDDPQG